MGDKIMAYKYGDHVPMDVLTLETVDGDIRFQRKGKGWDVIKGGCWSPGRTYYNNSGDLLWEWGQMSALRDVTDKYAAAVEWFKTSYGTVAKECPADFYVSREARKHVHALIAKIQEDN